MMVSHIEPPPQVPQTPRRPPSVTSRASTTRRRRSSRSQHTTSPQAPLNEFPVFAHTGDVEIVISSPSGRKEQRYLLHSIILGQCSSFFAIDTKRPPVPNALPAPGPTALLRIGEPNSSRSSLDSTDVRRWSYVLDWHHTTNNDVPRLIQRPPSQSPPPVSRNKPPASSSAFFRSMSNLSALSLNPQPIAPPGPDDELLRDFDNLFRIFYNFPPTLSNINIADAYTESKALLHLAQMYDALDVVGSRVDHHLLGFQGRLFKQIARYPPSYLKLACLAKSRVIFTEALIHVVGQWPQAQSQLVNHIDPLVLDIIEDKVQELEDMKLRIEIRLFRLTLTTSRGERVNPSNGYLDWMAMSLFRQWLAENTTPAPVSILKNSSRPSTSDAVSASASVSGRSGRQSSSSALVTTKPTTPQQPQSSQSLGRVYRLMGSTNKEAYLNHDECKRFLKLTPEMYSRDNLKRFERRVDELKNLARDAVKPLTRNFLELDLGSVVPPSGTGRGTAAVPSTGLGYLTCTKVLEDDFPWNG
ncbi:hypothetical protein D6C97_07417 [Aureobasidium pullulans]|uniref:BTB domain-containing protein n=1 Tax=Aureobasidium pullulans TaxID=5580 RepID=A0A4V4K1K3_AURPU|nr:hypothetical protein D6D24_10557 [Aureobasidium pullulans]THY49173.1 hypothetical protein D6C97_07417 [Aureobasidium pullulans]